MTETDFLCLTPLIIIALAPILIMLTVAFRRNFQVIHGFSLVAFTLALLSIYWLVPVIPHRISSLFIIDGFTLLLSTLILLAGLVVTLLSKAYIQYQVTEKEEYYMILFVAVLGSLILIAASNFVTLFLGLETLSISLFILIAYKRLSDLCLEAGVKYLVLASVASAFLLFGMGLIYADTGTLEFSRMASVLGPSGSFDLLLLSGFGMMIVGLGFKLALVPFHMWTPDIYQGAPASVATFIATISKGAVMGLFLRFFYLLKGYDNAAFIQMVTVIAILSMFVGNLLAIRQQNVKRILAYSSISNMGYLLVTLLVGGENGIQAAVFYLVSYIITTLGAFGVVALLSDHNREAEKLDDFKGLFWKQPWMAFVFTLAMLSLAGIPLTAGFMAKFYIVFAGIHSSLWLLVIMLTISSIIGLYYYLRVVSTMFAPAGENQLPAVSFTGKWLLGVIVAGIIWLGLFPQGFIHLLSRL